MGKDEPRYKKPVMARRGVPASGPPRFRALCAQMNRRARSPGWPALAGHDNFYLSASPRVTYFGLVVAVVAALGWINAGAAKPKNYDCHGTPPSAVMTLPEPLAKWATLVCTPYGHIISNKPGWIWSREGGYSPVFIPSQMVKMNPVRLGNQSYFTKISMAKVDGSEFTSAYSTFHGNFAPDPKLPDGYRLDVTSISGRALLLYFFDYGASAWGLWCTSGICDPASRFMIIDMSQKIK